MFCEKPHLCVPAECVTNYPLVNIPKPMENHHFVWVNGKKQTQWHFSIANSKHVPFAQHQPMSTARWWPSTAPSLHVIEAGFSQPMGVSINGINPNSWMVYMEKNIYKWMITGGAPILGKPHMLNRRHVDKPWHSGIPHASTVEMIHHDPSLFALVMLTNRAREVEPLNRPFFSNTGWLMVCLGFWWHGVPNGGAAWCKCFKQPTLFWSKSTSNYILKSSATMSLFTWKISP